MAVHEDLRRSPFLISGDEAEYVLMATDTRSDGSWPFVTGVASQWWPHADLFADRAAGVAMQRPSRGCLEPYGGPDFASSAIQRHHASATTRGVIWGVCQEYPGAPKWDNDNRDKRVVAFQKVMHNLAQQYASRVFTLTTLAVPLHTGCEGDTEAWPRYLAALRTFADATDVRVLIVKSLNDCSDESMYKSLPPRQVEVAERSFLDVLVKGTLRRWQENGPFIGRGTSLQQKLAKAGSSKGAAGSIVVAATAPALSLIMQSVIARKAAAAAGAPHGCPFDDSGCRAGAGYTTARLNNGELWTVETWYQKNIKERLDKAEIMRMRALNQGDKDWSDSKNEMVTTSSFHRVHKMLTTGDDSEVMDMVRGKVHGSTFTGNRFTRWGNDNEDHGNRAFEIAQAHGLLDELLDPKAQIRPLDSSVTISNKRLAELAAGGEGVLPPKYTVIEFLGGRGANVDTVDLVTAYSYDGLYRVINNETKEEEWLLVEVKCTQDLLQKPRVAHVCQMFGMMGGLRKPGMRDIDAGTGFPIVRCVYVVWKRHTTRFFSVPFNAEAYEPLRAAVVSVWFTILLPLFVARDNGLLPIGELSVPHQLPDLKSVGAVMELATAGATAPRPCKRRRRQCGAVLPPGIEELEVPLDLQQALSALSTPTKTPKTPKVKKETTVTVPDFIDLDDVLGDDHGFSSSFEAPSEDTVMGVDSDSSDSEAEVVAIQMAST